MLSASLTHAVWRLQGYAGNPQVWLYRSFRLMRTREGKRLPVLRGRKFS